MATMAFSIEGAGYGALSAGQVRFFFRMGGNLMYYTSSGLWARGPRTSVAVWTDEPVTVPDNPILNNFSGQIVRCKIRATSGFPSFTDMTFKIQYATGNQAIVYETADPLTLRLNGIMTTDIDFVGTLGLEQLTMATIPTQMRLP